MVLRRSGDAMVLDQPDLSTCATHACSVRDNQVYHSAAGAGLQGCTQRCLVDHLMARTKPGKVYVSQEP